MTFNRSVNREIISKLFIKFSSRYGHTWSSRHKTDQEWLISINDWLNELKDFDLLVLKKAVKQACLIYLEFPPTLGQLVNLCLKATGMPFEDEIISLLIKREFNHPLVKMIYDRIGSWTLTNGKTEEIRFKIKAVYADCLTSFRESPEEAWKSLSSLKQAKLAQPELPKIPSHQERMTFNERMAECLKRAEESKRLLGDQKHPEFANKETDKEVWATYKKYLLDLPEELVITLPIAQAYDRNRFLAAIDTSKYLKEVGYDPNLPGRDKNASKGIYGPQKIFKNWVMD